MDEKPFTLSAGMIWKELCLVKKYSDNDSRIVALYGIISGGQLCTQTYSTSSRNVIMKSCWNFSALISFFLFFFSFFFVPKFKSRTRLLQKDEKHFLRRIKFYLVKTIKQSSNKVLNKKTNKTGRTEKHADKRKY